MNLIFRNLLWFLVLLGPLLFLQRKLHRELQGIILLLTHRPDITMLLFSIIFLPGVLLHEMSHYITARLLGVRTGKLSLFPRALKNGKIQLGYVETVKSDVLRDAVIGLAPFITGSVVVALAGVYLLNIDSLFNEVSKLSAEYYFNNIKLIYDSPDFWLWFYFIFTVSSTMMPSSSDRRAWLPLAVILLFIIGITLLIGIGPWLFEKLITPLRFAYESIIFVLGVSVIFHSILLPPTWLVRQLLERITGYQIN